MRTNAIIRRSLGWIVGLVFVLSVSVVGASAQITLDFWTPFATHPVMVDLVDEYNATHPEVQVVHSNISGGDAEQYIVAVVSGTVPNIGWTSVSWFLDMYDEDIVVPIDELAARDGYPISSFFPSTWDPQRINGHQWGMPFEIGSDAVIYNADMFANAGLSEPQWDWTWDEFVQIGQILTNTSESNDVNDVYGFQRSAISYIVLQWLWRNGGDIVTPDGKTATFDDIRAIEALQWYADLDLVHGIAGGDLRQGSAAMVVVHPGWYDGDAWPFQAGTAPTPVPIGGQRASLSYYKELLLFRSTPEEEAASWEFLKWLMEPNRIALWFVETGYLPVSRDILMTDRYQAYLQDNSWLNPYIAELDYARDFLYNELLTLLQEAINTTFEGGVSARGVMESLQPRAQALLDARN